AAKDGYQSGRNAAWEEARGYPADDGGPVELFDVRKDVGQKTNLASALPEKAAELRALLDEILAGERTAP
ncbi:MAG: arylsulfatase, partial [Planctomycetota bacterium]